jgi:cytochrome c oxidase assembly factor CtaG
MILMALTILGAVYGFIPAEGEFKAPKGIILSISICLFAVGLAILIPQSAPAIMRTTLGFVALATLAAVCNWTAFAPEVTYTSSSSIGPFQFEGEDPIGGRIVFGLAAIVVDIFIIAALIGWLRSRSRKDR